MEARTHKKVVAILFHWSNARAEDELQSMALMESFKQYCHVIGMYKIDSVDPDDSVQRALDLFKVKHVNKNTLLIVHYIGHGYRDGFRGLLLAPNRYDTTRLSFSCC